MEAEEFRVDPPLPSRLKCFVAALFVGVLFSHGYGWTAEPRTYRGRLHRVIDGDTIAVMIDHGFDIFSIQSFRVRGVDCPEMRGGTKETRKAAKVAKLFTLEWCDGHELTIRTTGSRSFTRWVADIERDGQSLAAAIIESGNGIQKER